METLDEPEAVPKAGVPKYAGQTMLKTDFLKWESDDASVYEFNDGTLEPTLNLKPEEIYLINRLLLRFLSTQAFQRGGTLMPEADCWLTEKQMRRPDASFYTKDQLQQLRAGARAIPAFVVELIPEYDEHYKTENKLREYFEAGVQVVWWVFPPFKSVHVYNSPKTVVIASDADVISAAPALPDFTMAVDDLFRLD